MTRERGTEREREREREREGEMTGERTGGERERLCLSVAWRSIG